MNKHITGQLLDDHLKVIEFFHESSGCSFEALTKYLRFIEDNRSSEEIPASYAIEKHAHLLTSIFMGILRRPPEVGAFRYYLPNVLWGEEKWEDLIQHFLELPEVQGRYSSQGKNISSFPLQQLGEVLALTQNILVRLTEIKNVDKRPLIFPTQASIGPQEMYDSIAALRDMLSIIYDRLTQQ